MDLNSGKVALLQALALMSDEDEIQMKITNLMDSIHEDKGRTVTSLCEALAVHKQEMEKKKKVVELLEEIAKWWDLLVEDREKLLLTISNLELEKQNILKKRMDPKEIYGPLNDILDFELGSSSASMKKKPRLSVVKKDDDDDFKDSPKKTTSVVTLDE